MGACNETSAVGVWGWDHFRVDKLVNDGPPPKRKGGVSWDWYCGGLVEGVHSCGEFLLEKKCFVA